MDASFNKTCHFCITTSRHCRLVMQKRKMRALVLVFTPMSSAFVRIFSLEGVLDFQQVRTDCITAENLYI